VAVSYIENNKWRNVVYRPNSNNESTMRVDKLATTSGTYSFCLRSLADRQLSFKIQFNTGIEMMELSTLPDLSDGDNLEREITWIDQQVVTLGARADSIEGLRRINNQISNMVGNKMIIFAIIGLVAIAAANVIYFKVLKKTFKDRKLI
jgi:hypothetical protein